MALTMDVLKNGAWIDAFPREMLEAARIIYPESEGYCYVPRQIAPADLTLSFEERQAVAEQRFKFASHQQLRRVQLRRKLYLREE